MAEATPAALSASHPPRGTSGLGLSLAAVLGCAALLGGGALAARPTLLPAAPPPGGRLPAARSPAAAVPLAAGISTGVGSLAARPMRQVAIGAASAALHPSRPTAAAPDRPSAPPVTALAALLASAAVVVGLLLRSIRRRPAPLSLLSVSGPATGPRIGAWEVKLLYDGDCPLCLKEVNMLKGRNARHGNRIRFVDIADPSYDPAEHAGISFEQAMAKIHAIKRDGEVVTGVPVFVLLYDLVGLGWVYRFLRIPGLLPVAQALYDVWAHHRLRLTGRHELAVMLEALQQHQQPGGGTAEAASCRLAAVGATAAPRLAPPPWSELALLLQSLQAPEERDFRARLAAGHEPSPLAAVRLFGNDGPEDVTVTLYRDNAGWCPYCQRVWMALEEMQISYRVEKVPMSCYGDKPPAFVARFGEKVPAAIILGKDVTESEVILGALEEINPSFPLQPALDSPAHVRYIKMCSLVRAIFMCWTQWLVTGDWGNQFHVGLDKLEHELGVGGGPYIMSGIEGMEGVADDTGFSLVDIKAAPFLERMAASIAYYKGINIRNNPRWPRLSVWFDAMDSRPTYAMTKGDYYTHAHALPPQLGGCVGQPNPYSAEIDGTDDRGWTLPLPESDDGLLEPFRLSLGGDDLSATRREAAERLIANHENIVRFASRGAGEAGVPGVAAPLSDPKAQPAGPEVQQAVDEALRCVVQALLDGPEQVTAIPPLDEEVRKSLRYLQERVGVPRDMSYAAARQLRAHIGWLMAAMENPSLRPPASGAAASVVYRDGPLEVVLYTGGGCTLCDKAKEVLQGCRGDVPHTLRVVDIRGNEALHRKYRYDIPVVFIDGKYYTRHRLEASDLRAALQAAAEGNFVARKGEPDASDLE